jgi:adenine-specific DNA-methyltransferase
MVGKYRSGGVADLKPYQSPSYDENECEPRSVAVDDVVPVAEYDQPIYAGLKETGRVERGGDKPYQVVINGENYHALETLAFAYAGKVDCIYIDPPYNTGARDWKYNNDYVDGSDAYRHSKWLAFMERRLKLAKQLLNPNDSVLIVTIDEKEYLRLGLLLEQVFPEAHIQMVSIVINPNGVARDKEMYRLEEYAFYVYVGDAGPSMLEDPLFTSDINQRKEIADDAISRSKRGVRWEWLMRGGSNSDRLHSPGCFYPVYIDPKKKRIVEVGDSLPIDQHPSSEFDKEGLFTAWPIARGTGAEKVWQMNPGNLRKLVVQGLAKVGAYDRKRNRYSILYLGKKQRERIERGEILIVGRDDNNIVELEESEEQQILKAPKTIWNRQAHNAGEYGSRLVRAMLPQRVFPYPKSLYAVEDALKTVTKDKRDALIVDFFSGSGTTAHAVMRLNHQDGGHRCSISITNNEVSEDETKKLIKRGLRQGDPDWEALGICRYITMPRVTAAITGKTPEGDSIKGDYKFTDEFPMADGFEENAVFFDLTYEDPDAVELGVAFEEIAPLLWLRAGSRGSIIKHEQPGFAMADAYAVLFDFASVGAFIDAVKQNASIGCAYVITDDTARYASVKAQLPGLDVVRLYENYLQSFKIAAEDAVR